jgi:anthranilate synthase/aminodeoxychorismate synthase-like glutamine amidotransferase
VCVIDNYDSFTFNLVHLRNDVCGPATVMELAPDALLFSPGPCTPSDAGQTLPLLAAFAGTIPILGVCLGHQAIAHHFGGTLKPANPILHGKTSPILHEGRGIFEGLPSPFPAARYNSLTVDERNFPGALQVIAHSPNGEIMALAHRDLKILGVQFHPESILTECGEPLLRNWLGTLR